MDAAEQVKQWAEQACNFSPASWERMPELDLYMDQVTSYLNRQLIYLQCKSDDTPPLTSSMINNYVKDGLIPRPEQKKYKKEQLAGLMLICGMKQTLSMPDIAYLLSRLHERCAMEDLYRAFTEAQSGAVKEVSRRVMEVATRKTSQEELLQDLALTLTIEANARRAAAEKILASLQDSAAQAKHHKKEETNERV